MTIMIVIIITKVIIMIILLLTFRHDISQTAKIVAELFSDIDQKACFKLFLTYLGLTLNIGVTKLLLSSRARMVWSWTFNQQFQEKFQN